MLLHHGLHRKVIQNYLQIIRRRRHNTLAARSVGALLLKLGPQLVILLHLLVIALLQGLDGKLKRGTLVRARFANYGHIDNRLLNPGTQHLHLNAVTHRSTRRHYKAATDVIHREVHAVVGLINNLLHSIREHISREYRLLIRIMQAVIHAVRNLGRNSSLRLIQELLRIQFPGRHLWYIRNVIPWSVKPRWPHIILVADVIERSNRYAAVAPGALLKQLAVLTLVVMGT